jgi:hypothetical protein
MLSAVLITFSIAALFSYLWVEGIDDTIKYQKENPDADLSEGWLDWDLKNKN